MSGLVCLLSAYYSGYVSQFVTNSPPFPPGNLMPGKRNLRGQAEVESHGGEELINLFMKSLSDLLVETKAEMT